MDAIFHFGLALGLFYLLIICLCFAKDHDNKKQQRDLDN